MGPEGIDIIVPVYRNAALTARCLQSIAANLHELSAFDVRLLLINDSPGEPEVAAVLSDFAARQAGVQVLENEVNQGFVKTVNRGLLLACRDRRDAILVNSDTETHSGTLAQLVATAYSDPQIAFVSPRSNNASLCSLPHLDSVASSTPEEAVSRWRWTSRTMPAHHLVPTAVGFYLYIKRTVLANLGLLDTCFGAGYEEENDFIMRANKLGYRAALANHAYVFHAGSASFSLTAISLDQHRADNLRLMSERHAEFLPLLRRYESSPHFRAEKLLGMAAPSADKRLSVAFDLSGLGCDFNGTNEFSVGVLSALSRRHPTTLDLNILCSEAAFKFHGLDALALRRHDPHAMGEARFAVAVRFGQPFDLETLTRMCELAALNVYCMLDTIAEDCGYLSISQSLDELWGFVAEHANGIGYISQFSQRCFESRFPAAIDVPKYTHLLPTRLSEYRRGRATDGEPKHVMIMGNHYAHKASQVTADTLSREFPSLQFALLGKETRVSGNVHSYKAGLLSEEQIRGLYDQASMVVLPSYVEGFGLGVVHALAARKVVVARDIPATREILATYRNVSGVFLYGDDAELVAAVKAASRSVESAVDDADAQGWDDWAAGFADFCLRLAAAEDLFPRLVQRIRACDLLERAARGAGAGQPDTSHPVACSHVRQLLSLDGEEFVRAAYATVFARHADPEGLQHYLRELDAGLSKFALISRLRASEEGRSKNLPLAGFRRVAMAQRLRFVR